ncbi:aromatic hydrocarbon degradation protein [cyanobacterium G8-9]|nr:aromatic hydrocarbon degradation protein [cyanobacterium G8-9]
MKTKTLTKLVTLSLITATTLHATNGDNLIGIGAKARGMGGVGIALSHGAESALSNPALITSVEGTDISFGGTIFMPTIETAITAPLAAQMGDSFTSDADMNMIPEVSIATKINENWYVGIGMWGTAGMGTDYSQATSTNPYSVNNFKMVTNLQLLQFGVPIAYKTGGLSLAVTPVMQYGNLDINYLIPANPMKETPSMSVGAGLAQDFGFGYNLGISYDLSNDGVKGLTLGATYKSSIEMTYDGQITNAMKPFLNPAAGANDPLFSITDTLEQPAEYGLGIAYVVGPHTVGFDYRNVQWSDTQGYGDFGWEDQDVYAFGYQYSQDNWAVRAGYNYASSAVVEGLDPRLNFFNLLGFPATAETHYTLGGSYAFSNSFSIDLAYVYLPTSSKTYDITGVFEAAAAEISTDHREDSISFQLNYKF